MYIFLIPLLFSNNMSNMFLMFIRCFRPLVLCFLFAFLCLIFHFSNNAVNRCESLLLYISSCLFSAKRISMPGVKEHWNVVFTNKRAC